MQDFFLGFLLFVVYFCVASCFRYESALDITYSSITTTTLDATQTPDTSFSHQTHSSITPFHQVSNLERHINNESSFNPETEPLEQKTTTELAQEASASARLPIRNSDINSPTVNLIKDLKLKEARKVASQLNIQQQVNKVKKPLDFLQREICQKLKHSPLEVTSLVTQIVAARKLKASRAQTSQSQKLPA